MRAQINLVGNKYGLLTVVSYEGLNSFGNSLWNCICDCGRKKSEVLYQGLEYGKRRSCGKCNLEVPPYEPKVRKYRKRRRKRKGEELKPINYHKKKVGAWKKRGRKPKKILKKPGVKPYSETRLLIFGKRNRWQNRKTKE